MIALEATCEPCELIRTFSTSGGSIDCLFVLRVELREGAFVGRGEGVPSGARMVSRDEGREIAEQARAQVLSLQSRVAAGLRPTELLQLMPTGPARNALDCALWDLEAKRAGRPIAALLDVHRVHHLARRHDANV